MNLRETVNKAKELDEEYKNIITYKLDRQSRIAKELGVGGKTNLYKAIYIVENGSDDDIDLIDMGIETLNSVWKKIRVEKGIESPTEEVQREIIKKYELDEKAASAKISSMYDTIQDLREENRMLKRNPTETQLKEEQDRRKKAESTLESIKSFMISNPLGINPEAVKVKTICETLSATIPDKNSFDLSMWSNSDRNDCAKSLQNLVTSISSLLELIKIA